jgi:hypothetical protein
VPRLSPTIEGFRAAFRRPSLTFGEISWRWSVGAATVVLLFFGLFEYLQTLPVTNGELLFLRTRHPFFVAQALAHILRGGLSRAALSAIVGALLLTLLWIVAASLGRMITVRVAVEYFRETLAKRIVAAELSVSGNARAPDLPAPTFQPLMHLNFLRAAVALACGIGVIGASVFAGYVWPSSDPDPGLFLLLVLPLIALICFVGWVLNWLLSLAAILAVRDGSDAVSSMSAAVSLCRERPGAVFAVSTWTGFAHLALFMAATSTVAMPLGFLGLLPWRLVALAVLALTLVYFAVADWLYIARLAGYVCILEMPEALLVPPLPTNAPGAPPLQMTIDRDELILSDVPGLIPET